jgi:hypothetical protein
VLVLEAEVGGGLGHRAPYRVMGQGYESYRRERSEEWSLPGVRLTEGLGRTVRARSYAGKRTDGVKTAKAELAGTRGLSVRAEYWSIKCQRG